MPMIYLTDDAESILKDIRKRHFDSTGVRIDWSQAIQAMRSFESQIVVLKSELAELQKIFESYKFMCACGYSWTDLNAIDDSLSCPRCGKDVLK
jgi:hypothetical protein